MSSRQGSKSTDGKLAVPRKLYNICSVWTEASRTWVIYVVDWL